ncbi:DUF3239 domain-containing protein [Nocardia donostiensis]|uniref:Histidine kinase n=1 Tax=Nocardia donostiensis TaxID=1538463 RepID=A0A1W0B6E0_9NOCA|nr:DUF3239 domain-containing protein [Nocardia donostiensis]ONM50384.1 histidine kinase [Nocardia donostiensis]OQS17382.1 histidine kinase [Nocardia donostiensis]OQS18083.1 histidine kinase [Nocardia donostiensis]
MRRFEFAVDRRHARAVNEVVADLRRLRILAVAAAVVAAACTAYLIWLNHPWSYLLAVAFVLGTATSLWVALWAPRRSNIQKLYADGELVPAVVSRAKPGGLVLLALVDVARPDTEPRYALVTRKVRALPGHQAQPGERVPSIAVRAERASRTVGERWLPVDTMPIAWGTADAVVIERARAAISEAEWQLLADNLSLAEQVRRSSAKRLLLDPQRLPGGIGR